MRVLLRCDGGGSLGVGHVIRSLALAEAAVAAGHEVVVAGRFEGPFLQRQLAAAPVEVVELAPPVPPAGPAPLLELIHRLRPDVLHVDSYPASDRLREQLVAEGAIFSNMEDGTFGRRPADVVVDPTFGAEHSPRPQDGSGWLLRGSRYTPVRRRVIDARRPVPGSAEGEPGQVAGSVLVVMGGTDPVGLAPAAVGLLARTGLALEVTVIADGENAVRTRTVAEGSSLSLNVLAPVDDLATLMSTRDLVISAAGTSIWELFCIGVPAAVVWAVDNQRHGYDRVVAAGLAIGLGGPDLVADERADERAVDLLKRALTDTRVRADLVAAGRRIVDGLGAWRVVATWEQASRQSQRRTSDPSSTPVTGPSALVARPATLQDARLLWHWRNDPVTRASSRSSEEVPWEDHLRWLNDILARTDRLLFVVEDPAEAAAPVGTVRWDLLPEPQGGPDGGHEWEVSITVAPQRRGQSLARPLLRAGELALSAAAPTSGTDVSAYVAVVHCDNGASVRLFETSGYVPDLPADPGGFMRFRKIARVP